MSNDTKQHQMQGSALVGRLPLAAWLILVAIAATLAALVSALPSPASTFARRVPGGVSAQLDHVAIIVATVVTWILVAWLAGVLILATIARVALRGRRRDFVVTRLAQLLLPRALRGVVITAVGVGAVAAMTGCAPGAAADTPTVTAGVGTSDAASPMTISLDWPVDPPAETDPGPEPPLPPIVTEAPTTSLPSGIPNASPTSAEPASAPSDQAEATQTTATPTSDPGSAAPDGDAKPVPASPAGPAASGPSEPTAGSAPEGPSPVPAAPAPPEPAATPTPEATLPPSTDTPSAATVTVADGDSLWSLAAAHLPADATDVDVALAWPHWYAANRAVIGDDPGHIEPGWQLTVPSDREDPS